MQINDKILSTLKKYTEVTEIRFTILKTYNPN
jgi:hypothetical protein